ncbi:probable citrate synthase 1, mitochondrial [Teleopsis dalmanni]|uniref:probable citrate synthase 1, mitochondrial n=1 Tax=Teleopsis dalmanni TaxID=139649 RepID=UPI0018CCE07A|nr:probable citrate synthase 1, mitochondrial [Teleopsis dalmanni]XP_037935555.1 probable citrate synthase 1, mitochondrial [Teleopsis dalmanni]XP_037935556.1 probable citrate synthase 1, mitochondrial [Teleopsis dalmanni]
MWFCRALTKVPLNQSFVRLASSGTDLKLALESKIDAERKKVAEIRKNYKDIVLSQTTIGNMYGGMRSVVALLCDTSNVDPNKGIRYRGLHTEEFLKQLPKGDCGEQPLPEGVFWFLLTGDIPTKEQCKALTQDWYKRSPLPDYAENLLNNLPQSLHPMAKLSCVITALHNDSSFVKAYNSGVKKTEYWKYYYEDSMNIIAKLPLIGSKIYATTFCGDKSKKVMNPELDWTANFVKLIGFEDETFTDLMRLYFVIHADHATGNVSSHTTHLVGSALSDPYLCFAAGMNGLAGPLHGLANQEVLKWLGDMKKEIGDTPTDDKIKEFVQKTLKSGQVIPGFGHAVLRVTDPRYTCQREFALKYLPDDKDFKIVSKLFEIVPPILKATGKVSNPYPNVDAHSGVLLQHFGLTETSFYTVLFGISRALGVLASLTWHRILLMPIERPKSISTYDLLKLIDKKKTSEAKSDCKK